MRKAFKKPSKQYSIRSNMRIVIENFGDSESRRSYNAMFQLKSFTTPKAHRFRSYTFKTRDEAWQFLIEAINSGDVDRLRDAAYYSITNADPFQILEDKWFIKLCGLIFFGNHENCELGNIVSSCSTEFDTVLGMYPVNSNATLIVSWFHFYFHSTTISECRFGSPWNLPESYSRSHWCLSPKYKSSQWR